MSSGDDIEGPLTVEEKQARALAAGFYRGTDFSGRKTSTVDIPRPAPQGAIPFKGRTKVRNVAETDKKGN